MGEKSWRKEFYPIAASKTTKETALEHSLQKWIGIRQKNLKKHGLEKPPIEIDGGTCALCAKFGRGATGDKCGECPLFLVRGEVRCDMWSDEDCVGRDVGVAPYYAYNDDGSIRDPEPMIFWLRKAVNAKKRKTRRLANKRSGKK